MKILELGKKIDTMRIFTLCCKTCNCKFEFEEHEAEIEYEKSLDGKFTGKIECPCCQEEIVFDTLTEMQIVKKETVLMPKQDSKYKLERTLDLSCDYRLTRQAASDHCADCPNNKKSLILGDSPCQWCDNNKFKITGKFI